MTEHTEVDLELLADYIGGALDGTPDAERVSRLVAGDPSWQRAFDHLAAGMTAAGAELHDLPPAGPVPDDVADRITAALAGLPDLDAHELARLDRLADEPEPLISHAPAPALEEPARHLHAVPETSDTGRGASRRQRRLRRWAVPLTAAAGVLAFAGVGLGGMLGRSGSGGAADSAGGSAQVLHAPADSAAPKAGAGADRAGTAAAPAAGVITASGRDYQRTSVAALPHAAPRAGVSAFAAPEPAPAENVVPPESVAPELVRLVDRDALAACLGAIGQAHGAGPPGVLAVDYARFEGVPALIVRFTADDGTWVSVSGSGCGTPGIGADTRYQVRVG